jgi:hypothetical protein
MYWEDADWCRRMTQKHWKVVYYPGTSIVHFTGKSSGRNRTRSVVEFHKSAYYLFKKHSPSSAGITKLVVILGLALRSGFVLGLYFLQSFCRKNGLQENRGEYKKQ